MILLYKLLLATYLAGFSFACGFMVDEVTSMKQFEFFLPIVSATLWPLRVSNYIVWQLTDVNTIGEILKAVGE